MKAVSAEWKNFEKEAGRQLCAESIGGDMQDPALEIFTKDMSAAYDELGWRKGL